MFDPFPATQRLPTLSFPSSSSTSDQKLPDKSSCPGTLFNLFDWNCHLHGRRLFGHKSDSSGKTYAEATYKDCVDEALACPLAAHDENRCGSFPAMETFLEGSLAKDQTAERKKKRSPNVVAKLMGLEPMPSPEPCRRQRRPFDSQNPNLMRTPDKTVYFPNSRVLSIKQGTHEGDGNFRGCSTRSGSTKKNLLPDLSCRQGNEKDITDKQHKQAQKQPIGNDPIVLSQVEERVHIKLIAAASPVPPAFSPKGAQKNTQGDKVVEEKPSATRSSRIDCVSSHLNSDRTEVDFKLRRSKGPTIAQTLHPIRGKTEKNKVSDALMSTSNASSKEDKTRPGSKHAIEPVKIHKRQANCRGSQQQLSSKTNVEVDQGFNQTEEPCNQLSQTAKVKRQGKRPLKAKAKMVSCPLKDSFARHEKGKSQKDLSADSTIVHQQASPSCSAKSVLSNKRPSSFPKDATVKDGNKIKLQKTGTRSTASPLVRGTAQDSAENVPWYENNLYLNDVQGRQQHLLTGYNEDAFVGLKSAGESTTDRDPADQKHANHCALKNTCSTDNTLMRNLQEKSETLDSSLTFESDLLHAELHDRDVQDSSRNFISSIFQDSICNKAATSNTLHMLETAETICQRNCESSLEEVEDTALSEETKSQKQTVSYSGKSTATILKELLLALNPSTGELLREEYCIPEEDVKLFNNTKGAKSTTIDYVKGPFWNDHADKVSTDADLCQDTFQSFHANYHKGNHSLKECADICWQPDAAASILPSVDEPAQVTASFFIAQGRETCEEESRTDYFKSSSQSIKEDRCDVQSTWEEARKNKESYVQHVVSSADISFDRVLSARLLYSVPLIKPGLFNELEETSQGKWQWGIQHEHGGDNHACESDDEIRGCPCFAAAKSNRKLVFDCIAEALNHDMGITEHESMQMSLPLIDPPSYTLCAKRVHRLINGWREMVCRLNVDDMVEKEMNSGAGKWHDFSSEIYQISVEIELNIFKDLIDELVLDLSTHFQNMPTRISYKVQGPVKVNRDRYFWVGL